MSEPASQDFVDRAIRAERRLVEAEMNSRDKALKLAISNTHYMVVAFMSLFSLLISLAVLFLQLAKH